MTIEITYYLCICIIGYLGLIFIKQAVLNHKFVENIRFKRNRYKDIINWVAAVKDDKVDLQFKGTGLKMSVNKYNIVRNILFSVFILISIIMHLKTGKSILSSFVLYGILYIISTPKEYFMGRKTPFLLIIELLKEDFNRKKDRELYKVITQLKNLAIAQQNKPFSGDLIIQQIMRFTKIIKPIFSQTLAMWRLGKETEAAQFFAEAFNTKLGREFSNLLAKLDSVNPIELTEQLTLFQTHVSEEKTTERLKHQELISNLIFMPVVAAALMIILNFVVIVIWLDSIQTLISY